jgi:deazaflavin-dependent oxidoreductase (nitroreductase family)
MNDVDYAAWNQWVVGEFHSKAGAVPGYEELPLLLLTTIGRGSGKPRVVPLCYVSDDDAYYVAATNSGRPEAPAWLRNIRAEPHATIDVGGESIPVVGEEMFGPRLRDLWGVFVREMPTYASSLQEDPLPIVMLTVRAA